MRKITTNLEKTVHFAVIDDSDRTIAVVQSLSGEQDITAKVLQTIKDDTLTDVELLYGTTTDPDDFLNEIPVTTDLLIEQSDLSDSISFDVQITDEDEEEGYTATYYLETIEIY